MNYFDLLLTRGDGDHSATIIYDSARHIKGESWMSWKDNTGETCDSCLDDKGKGAEDKHGGVVSVNIEVSCPVRGSAASTPGPFRAWLVLLLLLPVLNHVANSQRNYRFCRLY
jgi:hypothetical protein